MKILYLAMVELEVYNAPRTHTVEICKALHNLGHEVILLVPRPRKKQFFFPFKVIAVPFFGYTAARKVPFYFLLSAVLLVTLIRHKPYIIYERMFSGLLGPFLAWLFETKFVLEIDGPPFDKKKKIGNALATFQLKKADLIISSSPKIADHLPISLDSIKGKIKLVPDGVNTDLFITHNSEECRRRLGLEEKLFWIGYTGGIYWAYNFDFVFQVMARLQNEAPNVRLLIVGPHKTVDAPQNVLFRQHVPFEKVPLYINACHVCLWPRSKEGLIQWGIRSTKLHEYIACGKRVLVPQIQGEQAPQLIEDFIIWYRYGDRKDLKDKIIQFSKKKDAKAEGYIVKVKEFKKQYSWQTAAKKTSHFLKSL